MNPLLVVIEALASLSSRMPPINDVYDHIEPMWAKMGPSASSMIPFDTLRKRWGEEVLKEQGIAVCQRPGGGLLEVPLGGEVSYTKTAKNACRKVNAYPIYHGHTHPIQSAAPSWGDLDVEENDLFGTRGFCIARRGKDKVRALCIDAYDEQLTPEDFGDLRSVKENEDYLEDLDPVVEVELPGAGGVTMPIRSEEDASGSEQFFCDEVNERFGERLRCALHEKEIRIR